MFHLIASAPAGRLLFRTHAEARCLWGMLGYAFPQLVALCVMPDHLHLLVEQADAAAILTNVMSAYARWRNHQRGEAGIVWLALPPPERVPEKRQGGCLTPTPDQKHVRRLVRYVHLNPCRAGLVRDPLAWPWSTHRDAVGLAAAPLRGTEGNIERFHRYVSSDPDAAVIGTPLPTRPNKPVDWASVSDAVSAICRLPTSSVGERGTARTLALRTAWHLGVRNVDLL